MKRIAVTFYDEYNEPQTIITNVDNMFITELEPIKTSDELIMCIINSEICAESAEHMRKLKLRKDAVERLSNHIAKSLMFLLGKNDTHNGYENERI